MEKLLAQVRRAHTRLLVEQFMQRCVWGLFASLIVALIAIAVPRLFVIEGLPAAWDRAWLFGAAGAGLLIAAVWTWISHRSRLDAAIELDGRFGLRERVASSLSLSDEELATPAGRALLNDAVHRVERIEVSERFRPQLSRRALLPVVPACIALCVAMLVSPRVATSSIDPATNVVSPEQIKKSQEELAKKLAEKRKLAEQQGLKDAADVFKQIEKGTDDLSKTSDLDRKKATVKLNDLAKQLEQRKTELGGREELQKQLNNMKDFGQGPADKVASAIKQGDWKKALDEMNKLKDKLSKDDLTKDEKEQLEQQFEKMQQKLADAAQANRDGMEDLKKQIDEQKKNGDLAKAAELQQKLDKLAAQKPQMDKMQELAEKLGQCQQCMQQGDAKGAAAAMQEMADQLEQMQQEMDEMQMLDEALDQIQMAKDAMDCAQCQGAGCEACNGMGQNQGGAGKGDGEGGQGMGEGRGTGPRPDEENPTNFRDSQVRQKPGKGSATFGGLVEGPNVKGSSGLADQEQQGTLSAEPADPLTAERLPRSRREHAEEYFNKLREEL